ncbi:WD40/YVTN/BNR-like repeat-containing protein [Alicyclobacillus dauci]|uniref:Uncharacterized protein n=1 Tax=Alicyclobacillus dauci TaxID=1475485 RepID=A0ABY6Z6N9_9BACL|nr:hypothetical protein [Alicyclobacillus dauci]WAH38410.1 hypothetical protein NZD86_08005 [Alicyclobacillus dauci]
MNKEHGLWLVTLPVSLTLATACSTQSPTTTVKNMTTSTTMTTNNETASSADQKNSLQSPNIPWSNRPNQSFDIIRHIHMFDSKTGWQTGYKNRKFVLGLTSDGGTTWHQIPMPHGLPEQSEGFTNEPLAAIVNPNDIIMAWTLDNQVHIDRTTNGGQTWAKSDLTLQPPLNALSAIVFSDPQHGWIAAQSSPASGHTQKAIYRTQDGGSTWNVVSVDNGYIPSTSPTTKTLPESAFLLNLSASTSHDLWAGLEPTDVYNQKFEPLYHSNDGGKSWHVSSIPIPAAVRPTDNLIGTIAPSLSEQSGIFLAYTQPSNNTGPGYAQLYLSKDGGQSWSKSGAEISSNPFVTSLCDGRIAWLGDIHQAHLVETSNAGATWRTIQPGPLYRKTIQKAPLAELDVVNDSTAFAVFTDENPQTTFKDHSVLLKTTDGGLTWRMLKSQ